MGPTNTTMMRNVVGSIGTGEATAATGREWVDATADTTTVAEKSTRATRAEGRAFHTKDTVHDTTTR